MAWILHGFLWSWKIDKFVTLGEKIISSTHKTSKILMQHTEDTMNCYRLIIIRGHFSVPACCGLEFCCYHLRNWLSQKHQNLSQTGQEFLESWAEVLSWLKFTISWHPAVRIHISSSNTNFYKYVLTALYLYVVCVHEGGLDLYFFLPNCSPSLAEFWDL